MIKVIFGHGFCKNKITYFSIGKVFMSKKISLSKLTGIYMLGNFSSKIMSFILVFFMTHFMTREELGAYDLIITTVSFIVPCITLLIEAALLRWMLDEDNSNDNDKVLGNTFYIIILNFLVYSVCFFILNLFIAINFSIYLYLLTILQSIYIVFQHATRGKGDNKLYAFSSVLYSFVFVSLTVALLFFFDLKVEAVLLGSIVSYSIVIILLTIKNKFWMPLLLLFNNVGKSTKDKILRKKMLLYSMPLMPNTISWWLIGSSTRYIILFYLGADANGLFAISYKYPTIVLMFTNVFTMAWQEKSIMMEDVEDEGKHFTLMLEKYVKLLLGGVILLVVCSKYLMTFVHEDFYESWKYMPLLLYAVFLKSISAFYGAGFLKSKKTNYVLYSSLMGGGLTVFFALFLTPLLGLYGVCVSIVIGYLTLLIVRGYYLKKINEIKFPLFWFLSMSLCFIFASLSNWVENELFLIVSVLTSLILVFYVNKQEIRKIIIKLLNR